MSKIHIVEQGETLSSIAKRYGFVSWETLWSFNSELQKVRPNPHILFPGDKIEIPDWEHKQVEGSTEQHHSFKVSRPKVLLRMVFIDGEGNPFADAPYRLEVFDRVFTGNTSEDGMIEHEVPVDITTGKLQISIAEEAAGAIEIEPDMNVLTWPLKINHLDPIDKINGVQARLNNIGFVCGEVDGILGSRTQNALRIYQKNRSLSVDGTPNKETVDSLENEHGC